MIPWLPQNGIDNLVLEVEYIGTSFLTIRKYKTYGNNYSTFHFDERELDIFNTRKEAEIALLLR
jgi:hypothetical protein